MVNTHDGTEAKLNFKALADTLADTIAELQAKTLRET